MDARAAYCATPKTRKIVPVSAGRQLAATFSAVSFYFSSGAFLFLDFFFSFSESAESVAPITFGQLPGSAKMTPYLSATGTTPATNQESHRRLMRARAL
jgi:hypothetical protein